MGLGALRFWTAEHHPRPPLCQQATSIQCVKYGNTYTDKSFCWHTGGGGGDILKTYFLISIYFNVKLIVLPKMLHFKHLISKMDFTATKYSGQSNFTVKK